MKPSHIIKRFEECQKKTQGKVSLVLSALFIYLVSVVPQSKEEVKAGQRLVPTGPLECSS